MIPLQVTATMAGAVAIPYHPIALDALLAAAVCVRDNIPPATLASELQPIEIPVQREPGGRFHLASCGAYEVEQSCLRYVNRRPPIEQYQTIGIDKITRVQITAGPNKMYRIPMETVHLVGDQIRWWCIGDRCEVESLLSLIHYLGKRRAVGTGKVARWSIEAMEPSRTWEGFPVALDGAPLRPLPLDWPGLKDPAPSMRVMSYPYWDHSQETLCTGP